MSKPTRNTKQRQVIIEELVRLDTHPTAAELHAIVRRRLPRMSLGTVYRNLDLLVQLGVIKKIEGGGGQARYDGDLAPHCHLRCVVCGRVSDVPLPSHDRDDQWLEQAARLAQGRVLDVRVELMGICCECDGRLPPEERARILRQWQSQHLP